MAKAVLSLAVLLALAVAAAMAMTAASPAGALQTEADVDAEVADAIALVEAAATADAETEADADADVALDTTFFGERLVGEAAAAAFTEPDLSAILEADAEEMAHFRMVTEPKLGESQSV